MKQLDTIWRVGSIHRDLSYDYDEERYVGFWWSYTADSLVVGYGTPMWSYAVRTSPGADRFSGDIVFRDDLEFRGRVVGHVHAKRRPCKIFEQQEAHDRDA